MVMRFVVEVLAVVFDVVVVVWKPFSCGTHLIYYYRNMPVSDLHSPWWRS